MWACHKGPCSKTCGGGTLKFIRTCNNPTPSCGGIHCRGIGIHEEACNKFCCRGKVVIYIYTAKIIYICISDDM